MEKIWEWRRGQVFLIEEKWDKIIMKKAHDDTKKDAINKEVKIIRKLESAGFDFVPKILEAGDGYFKQPYIYGKRFDKVLEKSDDAKKRRLIMKLLSRIQRLDKVWIVHWELARPQSNIIVTDEEEVFIIDFDRGTFNDFTGKNLRSFAQWLHSQGYLTLEQTKELGQFQAPDRIYRYICDVMHDKTPYTDWLYKPQEQEQKVSKTKFRAQTAWMLIKELFAIIIWAGILIWVDQVSKYYLYDQKMYQDLPFITPVLNPGISWGIDVPMNIIYIVFALALVLFGYLYLKRHIWKIVMILFLAGAIGNMIDRFYYSGVRDFIDLQYWPVFNLADIFLSLGVILLLYQEFISKKIR